MVGAGVLRHRRQGHIAGCDGLKPGAVVDVLNRLNQVLKRGLGQGRVCGHSQGVHPAGLAHCSAPARARNCGRRIQGYVRAINDDDFIGRVGDTRHRQVERRKSVTRFDRG